MKKDRRLITILICLLGIAVCAYFGYKVGMSDKEIAQGENSIGNQERSAPDKSTSIESEPLAEFGGLTQAEMDAIRAEKAQEKAEEMARNRPGYRAYAKQLIKTRAEKEEAMSLLTSDHWAYEFVHDGYEMSKSGAYDGQWLKYEDDHTYEYGLRNEVQGSGTYHYSVTSGVMIMLDNDENKLPEEWNVKSRDEVMILEGATINFGNNPRQCKLLRWNGRPLNI